MMAEQRPEQSIDNSQEIKGRLAEVVKKHGDGKGLTFGPQDGLEKMSQSLSIVAVPSIESVRSNESVERVVEPTADPENYAERGSGVLGRTTRQLGRVGEWLKGHPVVQKAVAVGVFVGLGGGLPIVAAGCGSGKSENTTNPSGISSTQVQDKEPGSTSIPRASTTGSDEGEQTSTTKEKILYSELISLEELSPYNISARLEQAIKEKNNGTLRGLKLFEANDINFEQKISFYLFDLSGKPFVAFLANGEYLVEGYIINTFITDNIESHVLFANSAGKNFIDFKLGGEFAKKTGESLGQYSTRVSEKLFLEDPSFGEVTDIFKEISKAVIMDPYSEKKIVFTSKEQGAIDKIIKTLSPEERLGEQIRKNTTTTTESGEDIRQTAMEDLVIDGMTEEELKKQIVEFPKWAEIKSGQYAIPKEVQDLFQKSNPEEEILFVGEANDPTRLNAIIVSKTIREDYASEDYPANGFGTILSNNETTPAYEIMEFMGVVPIKDSRASNEFLIVGKVYPSNNLTAIRVNLDSTDGNTTSVQKGNYNLDVQKSYRGEKFRLFYQFENGFKLKSFIKKGDIIQVYFKWDRSENVVKDSHGYSFANTIKAFTIDDNEYDGFEKTLK